MKKFRWFAFFMAIVLFIVLSACQTGKKDKQSQATNFEANIQSKIVIGVTLQDISNEFITMLNDALLRKVQEYPDVEIIINDAEAKPDKQVAQMESFITQRVDAIIINPADANALIPSVESSIKSGIPVITLSSNISRDVGQVWSGSDNFTAGEIQAEYIVKQLKGKGNLAILRGPVGHMAEIDRYRGYRHVIDNYPDIKIVFDQTANWQREQAMAIMEDWVQAGVKIDAVLSQNDAMMLGALKAIEDSQQNDTPVTTGIDAIEEALDAIKEGRLNATCFQDSKGQAFEAIDMAIKAVKGEKIQNRIIPFELVTRDNVTNYYDRIRFN